MKKFIWKIKGIIALGFLSRLESQMRLAGVKRPERRRFWKGISKTYNRAMFKKILKEI